MTWPDQVHQSHWLGLVPPLASNHKSESSSAIVSVTTPGNNGKDERDERAEFTTDLLGKHKETVTMIVFIHLPSPLPFTSKAVQKITY